MVGFTDSEENFLSGGNHYRLNLPPNIPAANFWSVTLYEAENASGLANGQPFPSLGSRGTAAPKSTWVQELRREKGATGWRRCPAKGTSLFSDSMARPKLP
jgi:Protein of unknown function (DUF1214)